MSDEETSAANHDDEAQRRFGQGAWKLLSTPNDLFLALRDRPNGVMDDLNSFQPAGAVLAGDLAEMQPSDLLNFLHQGRRTGVLLTRSDGTERGIVLIEGNVAWACSTSPGERLGELLCRMGLADRARVEAALRDDEGSGPEHRRIGQRLVDQGLLSTEDVWRGLRTQVVEIFLGLLVARAGTFVFLRGLDRSKLPAVLALDTQGMLLDGLRRLDEMELYRTLVPSPEVRPRPTGKARAVGSAAFFTPEREKLLGLCDGARSLAELSEASALGEFEATKAAFKLVEAGYLQV